MDYNIGEEKVIELAEINRPPSYKKMFVAFCVFGVTFEAMIGFVHNLVFGWYYQAIYGRHWYIYYNGFFTSFESLFYFGVFGCLGFYLFWKYYFSKNYIRIAGDKRNDKHNI